MYKDGSTYEDINTLKYKQKEKMTRTQQLSEGTIAVDYGKKVLSRHKLSHKRENWMSYFHDSFKMIERNHQGNNICFKLAL